MGRETGDLKGRASPPPHTHQHLSHTSTSHAPPPLTHHHLTLAPINVVQAAHDSLVGGLWDAWFTHWVEALYRATPSNTPGVDAEAKGLLGPWSWEYLDTTGWRPFPVEISLQVCIEPYMYI